MGVGKPERNATEDEDGELRCDDGAAHSNETSLVSVDVSVYEEGHPARRRSIRGREGGQGAAQQK